MSRTRRNLSHVNDAGIRRIRTVRLIAAELAAYEEIVSEFGVCTSNRLRNVGRIPHTNDDLNVSAIDQFAFLYR